MAETYAIVESGGKQYRAEKGTELVVDRLRADEGASVNLRAVMFSDNGDVVLSGGDLEKVKVEAKVAEHLRGKKLRVFKYKPKKGYRRTAGHRSELTRLEVTEVKLLSRKPAAKAESKPKAEPKKAEKAGTKPKTQSKKAEKAATKPKAPKAESKAKGTTKKPAGKTAAEKQESGAKKGSAEKKGSAKKKGSAEKKPAQKKGSAEKKPAAKKGAAGKSSSAGKSEKKKQES